MRGGAAGVLRPAISVSIVWSIRTARETKGKPCIVMSRDVSSVDGGPQRLRRHVDVRRLDVAALDAGADALAQHIEGTAADGVLDTAALSQVPGPGCMNVTVYWAGCARPKST